MNPEAMSIYQQQRAYLLAAVMFYTRLPVPKNSPHSDEILNKSRIYFPVIGWLIGALAVLVFYLSSHVFPLALSVLLSMVATILATGAFHEDGFADSCDGLGGGWQKDQVLTIMKDSRVGTYAVVGLISLLAIKWFALIELGQQPMWVFALIYLNGHTVSRLLSSLVIEGFDYVQDIDASKVKPITDRRLAVPELLVTLGLASLPLLFLLFVLPSAILALSIAAALAWLFSQYCNHRIGGYTGDILGAVQQLSEVAIYLTIVALL